MHNIHDRVHIFTVKPAPVEDPHLAGQSVHGERYEHKAVEGRTWGVTVLCE